MSPTSSGARVATLSMWLMKVGSMTTLRWVDTGDFTAAATNSIIFTAGVPARFRPGSTVYAYCFTKTSGTQKSGGVNVDSAGTINFAPSSDWLTAYTSASTCRAYGGSISWNA